VSDEPEYSYSEVANEQLDDIEAGDDTELSNDVVATCEWILSNPERAQAQSSAIQTDRGIVMRLTVPSRPPLKVFWTTSTPRIEAVFPYPT
jgi:hypothetical protein